jgi:hypothetical protein
MSAALARETAIVASRDISLDRADVAPLVEDIYAWSLGPLRHQRISDKGRALSAGLPALRVVVADAPEGVDATAVATDVKRRLRGIAGHGEDDFWTTVHATDDAREARYLADLFFNANYWRVLAMRRGVAERSGFLDWLDQYGRVLAARGIANADACVVGSAVLEAIGLRDSTDIDCVIADREPRFHAGVVKLGPDVDLVTRGYHRRADGAATLTDAQVITDPRFHFRMRGLKFANPELVIDRKRQHGRPKDLADVALWDERLSSSGPAPDIDRAIVWLMPKTSGAALAEVSEYHANALAPANCSWSSRRASPRLARRSRGSNSLRSSTSCLRTCSWRRIRAALWSRRVLIQQRCSLSSRRIQVPRLILATRFGG